MTKETHSAGGYLFAALTFNVFISKYLADYNLLYKLLLFIVCFQSANLGALLPDLDTKKSYISKKWPYLAKFISKRCKHRGFTHSLLFLILLNTFLKFIISVGENNIILICFSYGVFLGYMSHIVLDLFTYEGVDLFFPLGFNIKFSRIKTSSKTEKHIYKTIKFLSVNFILYYIYFYFINI